MSKLSSAPAIGIAQASEDIRKKLDIFDSDNFTVCLQGHGSRWGSGLAMRSLLGIVG